MNSSKDINDNDNNDLSLNNNNSLFYIGKKSLARPVSLPPPLIDVNGIKDALEMRLHALLGKEVVDQWIEDPNKLIKLRIQAKVDAWIEEMTNVLGEKAKELFCKVQSKLFSYEEQALRKTIVTDEAKMKLLYVCIQEEMKKCLKRDTDFVNLFDNLLNEFTNDNSNEEIVLSDFETWKQKSVFAERYGAFVDSMKKFGVDDLNIVRHLPAWVAMESLEQLGAAMLNTRRNVENFTLLDAYAIFGLKEGMQFLLASGMNANRNTRQWHLFGPIDYIFRFKWYKELYELLQPLCTDQVNERAIDYLCLDGLNSINDHYEGSNKAVGDVVDKVKFINEKNQFVSVEFSLLKILKKAKKEGLDATKSALKKVLGKLAPVSDDDSPTEDESSSDDDLPSDDGSPSKKPRIL